MTELIAEIERRAEAAMNTPQGPNYEPCAVSSCYRSAGYPDGGRRGWCAAHYKRWKRHGSPTKGRTFVDETALWLKNIAFSYAGDDCLVWPFADNGLGYGEVGILGKIVGVHRLVCIATHGAPPSGSHYAIHTCGNGHLLCVNPNHIRWGTPKENALDKVRHDTHNRGERQWKSRLTSDQVVEILENPNRLSGKDFADKFSVSPSTISAVKTHKTWRWLTESQGPC